MPTITADLEDLRELVGRPAGPEELERLLRLAKAELKEHDPGTGEIRIELNDTNRPDLWCVEGIARQIRCHLLGESAPYPFFARTRSPDQAVEVDPLLEGVRPYVAAFLAEGPAVTGKILVQMIQAQEKLCENFGRKRRNVAIGIYNADRVRFPVRYTAAEPGAWRFTPLGFEEPLALDEILERHPKGRDYGHLVRGRDRYPLLVDATGAVLSFPPVINSRETGEVKVGDVRLFVEATGTEMRQLLLCMNIMAANFADRGFAVRPVLTRLPYDSSLGREVAAPAPMQRSLELSVEHFSRALGGKYTPWEIEEALAAYGVTVSVHGRSITAECPPFRDDYLHPMDVVEDFAISRGFDTFEPEMPRRFTVGKLKPVTLLADRVRDHLVGMGFEEIISNILSSWAVERENMLIPEEPMVEVDNVMSETYSVLRSSILPSLLQVEARSAKAVYPHRLFEAGAVCLRDARAPTGTRTEQRVAALWAAADTGFSRLHAVLDLLCYYLVKDYRLEAAVHPFYFEGRGADIWIGKERAGHLGEVHPEVLTRFGITMPCTAFEIRLDLLL